MDDAIEYGPAFSALNERQKKFVLAMASDPFGNSADWARAAGYPNNNPDYPKVQAFRLLQNPAIEAASLEVARGSFGTLGPLLATSVLLKAAADKDHPQQVKAAELILNRVGMHETQEVHVKHTDLTGEALMARLAAVAERLGLDAQKLIGGNVTAAKTHPVIEGKAVEVKDASSD